MLVQRQSLVPVSYRPLASGLGDPVQLLEKSDSHYTRSLHLSRKKELRQLTIAQMSSGHQQVTGNANSFNSLTNYGNIVNVAVGPDAERHQIQQWLSPLEPQQRHQGVRTDRLDGVGNWVLGTNKFRKWSDIGDGCAEPVLLCYGNPGVGKTYLR